MSQDRINNPDGLMVAGPISATALYINQPTITGAMLKPDAAIGTGQQWHRFKHVITLNGSPSADAAAVVVPVTRIYGESAVIVSAALMPFTAATGSAAAIADLKKNGSSILNSELTVDSATTALNEAPFSLSSAALVAGDVIAVEIVSADAGDGAKPKGLTLVLVIDEAP